MKSIPPEVYEQWDKFEDGEEDLYTVKKNPDFIEELQEIKQEISDIQTEGYKDAHTMFIRTNDQVKNIALEIIDSHISALNK